MEKRCCLVVLLLLCGSLIPVRGFAIRKIRAATEPKSEERLHKRSYRADEDFSTNRLADALDLIQSERLRLRENSYAPFEESPMQNLPYDEGYLEEEDDVADDEPTAEDVRNFIASLLTNDDEPQLSSDTEIDDMLEDEVQQPRAENQLPVARSELEDILSPSDDEEEMEKKGVANEVEGRPRKREYDPTFVVKKSELAGAELSEEEIETLLQDIKDMEIEELAREEEEAEEDESVEATQPASVEEIEDILKDDDEEEEAENEADEEDQDEEDGGENLEDWNLNPGQEVDLTPQDNAADWPMYPANEIGINKEWLLDQYLKEQGPPSIKRKRSGPVFEEIEEEVDEDDDEIGTAILAKYIAFEDEQNDNLVKALDLATKGQVEQTDKYIPEEVKYIQNAITDEQLLQAIQSLVETDEELAEDEAEADEEEILNEVLPEEFPEEKRQAPSESELETSEGNPKSKVARAMAKALRQYFAAHPEDLKDLEAGEIFPDQSDSEGEWYDKPLPDEEEGSDESDWELNPFYRSLLENYESSVTKRGYEDDEDKLPYTEEEPGEENGYSPFLVEEESPLLPITEEDMCPAVGLTDGCAWSAKEGLAMDSEARNLCKRHQLCYTCGAAHGMSKDVCDRGFIGETDSACNGDIECRLEGVELYIAMSNNQIYVPTSLTHRFCDSPCTYDYIIGANDKKR